MLKSSVFQGFSVFSRLSAVSANRQEHQKTSIEIKVLANKPANKIKITIFVRWKSGNLRHYYVW
jgi:hypothetical protein